MKIVYATHEQIAERLNGRPPEYWHELAPAIVETTAAGVTFDADHPAWEAAAAKYRPPCPRCYTPWDGVKCRCGFCGGCGG